MLDELNLNDSENIVRIADSDSFSYFPPLKATGANRILLKPNWGYPVLHPVTVSIPVMREVITGLQRVNPAVEILILEGVCSKISALDIANRLGLESLQSEFGVTFLDADTLPHRKYPNMSPSPQRYREMSAPVLLSEVDCRISIGCLKRTTLNGKVLISSVIKNLYGLFPREIYHGRSPHARGQLHLPDVQRIIADVYWTIGILFDGAVVDATQKFVSRDWQPDKGIAQDIGKVLWGDDLLSVEREACILAADGQPEYLNWIEKIRPVCL